MSLEEDFSGHNDFMKNPCKKIVKITLLSVFLYFLIFSPVFAQQTTNPYNCPVSLIGNLPELSINTDLSKMGLTGPNCVNHLKWYLNIINKAGLIENGIFDLTTKAAVISYQTQKGFTNKEGIVGYQTWDSLRKDFKALSQTGGQTGTQTAPSYTVPPLPAGQGLSAEGIKGLLIQFANFLIGAGVVIAIIVIVWSGIMYFRAGSDTEAKKAKGWFRNGIIGAFIILAVGVIILTIYNIVVNQSFFGGPGVPGQPTLPSESTPTLPSGPILGGPGNLCLTDRDCKLGLECKAGLFGRGRKTCKQP